MIPHGRSTSRIQTHFKLNFLNQNVCWAWKGLFQKGFAHALSAENNEKIRNFDQINVFLALLRGCGKNKDIHRGKRLHDDILKRGLLKDCLDALVTMYAKCGALGRARELFESYRSIDVYTWTALMEAYVQKGQCRDAVDCFGRMQQEGLYPNIVTFICILKACSRLGAIDVGEKIHDEIAKLGFLGKDVVTLGTALVDMYGKCGVLEKANRVLWELPIRDVVVWNALIAGYAQHGQGEEALNCFDHMQRDGLFPDEVTYLSILKACASMKAADKGAQIHDEMAKNGLLRENDVLGTALVDMYAKCGLLEKAQEVLEKIHVRDVVSWNALISGYIQHGQGEQALNCFQQMQDDGLSPSNSTFICILKVCGNMGLVRKGKQIHDEIAKQGLLHDDIMLGTALVDMYAKCGALSQAQELLVHLPVRDVIAWNALITGYAQHEQGKQALNCLEQMHRDGLSPNAVTFASVLKACGNMGAVDKGKKIHDEIAKQGMLGKDVILGSALVDMYAKCGALAKAQEVLEGLHVRDAVSWSALITGYAQQEGEAEQALKCFEQMQNEGLSPSVSTFAAILKACGTIGALHMGEKIHDEVAKQGLLRDDLVLGCALVDMYAKCGDLEKAQQALEELPVRDVASWNALITGCVQKGEGQQVLNFFERMKADGLCPDEVTFLCVLQACGIIGAADRGEKIHDDIVGHGLLTNSVVLGNALVDMYAKCGAFAKAQEVLEAFSMRDIVSWTALLAGYAEQGHGERALSCYEGLLSEGLSPNPATFACVLKACGSIGASDRGAKIHDEIDERGLLHNDIVLGNALVDMYAKCGLLEKAKQVLETLPMRDVTSWNSLIGGYAQHGQGKQALECYVLVRREGLSPDSVMLLCLVKACGGVGALDKGEEFHHEIARQGLLKGNVMLGNALIDMYGKCGALSKAQHVIEELEGRNVVSWNSLIAGYSQEGQAEQVLECFEWMEYEGMSPDVVTMSNVLSACSLLGLVEVAQTYFLDMSTKYGLKPELEHYTSLIDLFGRTGHLDKAVEVIEKVPSLDMAVWCAFLGACQKWGNVSIGRWAFQQALRVDKTDAAPYVLMVHTYNAVGMQEDAQSIETLRVANEAWIDKSKSTRFFSVVDPP